MNKKLLHLALLIILPVSCRTVSQSRYSPEVEERIKQVENNLAGWVHTGENDTWSISDEMKKYKVNGVSIAVINNYKVEWAKGYGFADTREKRPVTAATLFQAASISKSLNSLGILRLVHEGKLDLDTDVNRYLVSWKFPYDTVCNNKPITLKALLSHTAGLNVHGFPGYEAGKSIPSVTEILGGKPPVNTPAVRSVSEPGLRFSYSGGGVTLSQLVLTEVTNDSYADFMQRNVLDPIGMTSSFYNQPPQAGKKDLLATAYLADGSEVKGKYHIYPEQAAAGLWTTPSDLGLYITETQLSYKGESAKVIPQELTALRLTPVIGNSGLGTFVFTRGEGKYFTHDGGNMGFSCTLIGCLTEGKGLVVMTNSNNGAILTEITNSIATVYNWKDFYNPVTRKIVPVSAELLAQYTGTYKVDDGNAVISKSDDGLVISVYGMTCKMYFTSETDFFTREFNTDLSFQKTADGKVAGFTYFGDVAKKID